MNKSKLLELAERASKGQGADWNLNNEILSTLIGVNALDASLWYGGGRSVLSSLDRGIELLERMLPGWSASVDCGHLPVYGAALFKQNQNMCTIMGVGETPPRALVVAILKALHSKEDGK